MKKSLEISRRNFLKLCGVATTTAIFTSGASILTGCDEAGDSIILKNGLAYLDGQYKRCDILINNGVIQKIDETMTFMEGYSTFLDSNEYEIIDCADYFISPGWVDMHCHIGGMGCEINNLGSPMGVTALVDAGTYGPDTFSTFLNSYHNKADIPLFSFLNVRKDGIKIINMSSVNRPGVEDVAGAIELACNYPDIIKGFKVRTDKANVTDDTPMFLADITAQLGTELNLPVMYHLGDPEPHILNILDNIKTGDIITHCFRNSSNCVLDETGMIWPEVNAAVAKGVMFDVGHGLKSFMFDTARTALDKNFNDFTISSDLHDLSVTAACKARTFANVASKFLALGLGIEDITNKIAVRPRQVLGLPSGIVENEQIDLTLFSINDGCYTYVDSGNNYLQGAQRIFPEYTIINGTKVKAGNRDRALF